VIFTGSDEERDLKRAREVGAAAYVQKSHIDAVLLAAVYRAAERQQTPSHQPGQERTLEVAVVLA
jgi:DNA-binding NarL/FixJ family response regulator